MSLVAVGSAKGSPGATTLVAALGSVWPGPGGVLLAELDPAGGDLAIRLGLPGEPGLVTLAAEGRRGLTPELVWGHTSPFPGSEVAHVLAGPASADQATAALAAVGGPLAGVLAQLDDVDVLADCGRLDPGSPALAVARRADVVVVVARPSVAEIRHLSARVVSLGLRAPVTLVLVGDRPYGLAEVAGAVGIEALGGVAHDERGAELVSAGTPNGSRLVRTSALVRTTRSVAASLVARLGTPAAVGAATGAPAREAAGAGAGAGTGTGTGDRVVGWSPARRSVGWATETPGRPEMAPAQAADTGTPAAETGTPAADTEAPVPVTPPTRTAPRPGADGASGEARVPAPAGGRRSPADRPRRTRPLQPRSRSADGRGAPGDAADPGTHDRGGHR